MGILFSLLRILTPSWAGHDARKDNLPDKEMPENTAVGIDHQNFVEDTNNPEHSRMVNQGIRSPPPPYTLAHSRYGHSNPNVSIQTPQHEMHNGAVRSPGRPIFEPSNSEADKFATTRNVSHFGDVTFEPNASRNTRRPRVNVETFDGRSIDLNEWLVHFEAVSDWSGWTYE
ncbi:hypothetical protein BaRGS_00025037 [Batillaria attramentaria]|uniref:Uncharacterized protein n=1 Tax=Batillaria attramentaria TaxID=370345 RepID=A0ABD0K9B3_9CAEN